MSASTPHRTARLLELAQVFARIGLTGFGGPAATIAMMEDETVSRRGWLGRQQFLDMLGITNVIPGANAAEMALHVGYVRAGLSGLLVSGAAFVLPAALLSTLFAWAYVRFGTLPQAAPILYGIKPVVLALIFAALWKLGRSGLRSWPLLAIGLGVIALTYLGLNEVLALFAGGVLGMLALRARAAARARPRSDRLLCLLAPGAALQTWLIGAPLRALTESVAPSLWRLALFMLRVGAVLYGSGYVLAVFLEGGLVRDYGWLSQQQLLDAIAVGQITPGPLLSTVAFVGYLLFGLPGAVACTAAVFAPSFVFVLATARWVPVLRRSPWTAAFLDAINASSLVLMVIVTVRLGRAALVDWPALLIAALGAFALFRFKISSTWLVLGGALAGCLTGLLR
ncbi:MAG: chromate efflux transporter [Chloroflexi bacterium]|nr:chromate efflux transporter [Chloroflexota bacterium]